MPLSESSSFYLCLYILNFENKGKSKDVEDQSHPAIKANTYIKMLLRQFHLNVNSTRQFQFRQCIDCFLGRSVNFDEAFVGA
jgi:hypothetical protein